MTLSLAFSPCPNDTYLFHAWVHNLLPGAPSVKSQLADIQQLNLWALEGRHALTKASVLCAGKALKDYLILPTGCALGYDCGPKLISQPHPRDLRHARVAIPGRDTTAYLLFQLLLDLPIEPLFCPYHEVAAHVKKGQADYGVIIHETRFTFQEEGLVEVADLGALWHARYALPLPLGCTLAKRSLSKKLLEQCTKAISGSLLYAREAPHASSSYILEHSQVKEKEVVQAHIDLYVTAETEKLTAEGKASLETLFLLAEKRALIPPLPEEWLFA